MCGDRIATHTKREHGRPQVARTTRSALRVPQLPCGPRQPAADAGLDASQESWVVIVVVEVARDAVCDIHEGKTATARVL